MCPPSIFGAILLENGGGMGEGPRRGDAPGDGAPPALPAWGSAPHGGVAADLLHHVVWLVWTRGKGLN